MKTEEVAFIDASLGYSLPSHYREFMLRYGDEIADIKSRLPLRAAILTSGDAIIKENHAARHYAEMMTIVEGGDDEKPWPEDYFIVGTNGGGDFYFVMRSGCDPGLWFWSHESHEASRRHSSLDTYLAELHCDLGAPERWKR